MDEGGVSFGFLVDDEKWETETNGLFSLQFSARNATRCV